MLPDSKWMNEWMNEFYMPMPYLFYLVNELNSWFISDNLF